MGTFTVGCLIKNLVDRDKAARIPRLLVDTGSEATWIPRRRTLEQIAVKPEKRSLLRMANGQEIYRDVGYAIIRVGDSETADEVVFAEPGDYVLLGARALEGMALWEDAKSKKLVSTGPYPVAKIIVPGKPPKDKDSLSPAIAGVVQGQGGPAPVVPGVSRAKRKR
jgi:predicted aspartyl protease